MFKVSTGDARTDLYDINKGAAQIIDTTILRDKADQDQKEKFAEKQLKSKQDQARETDLLSNLSKMGSIQIMPKDQVLFAEKAKGIRDYVEKNHEALLNGDVDSNMEFQRLFGEYNTQAEMSKNFRETWEQRGLDIKKNPQAYRKGVLESHLGRAATDDAGNWDIDDSVYKKNINYNDRVVGDLSNYAQKAAQDTPYGKTFTLKQAEEVIASDLENPELFDQAAFDFENAADKLGAKDPVEYYKKKHAPRLVIRDTKAPPEYYMGGGAGSKEPKIRTNYSKTNENSGVLNWEYVSPPDNPYITTSIGDVRPGIIHDDGAKTYMEVTTKPNSDGEYEKKILGPEETREFVRLKLGTTLDALRSGKQPKHIDNKVLGMSSAEAGHQAAEKTRAGKTTAADFNAQWAKLKKGESLVGPDGKTYTKK